jgi:hypothetical protein
MAIADTNKDIRCAPVTERTTSRRVTTVELVLLLFFIAVTVAAAFGWTADSRDSADWQPSEDGRRVSRLRTRPS